jgi:hypothetical protein
MCVCVIMMQNILRKSQLVQIEGLGVIRYGLYSARVQMCQYAEKDP